MIENLSLQFFENSNTFDHGAAVMVTGFPGISLIAARLVIGSDGWMPFAVFPVGLIFLDELVSFIEDLEIFGVIRQPVEVEGADDGLGLDPPDFCQAVCGFIEGAAIIEASLNRVEAELKRIIE